MRFRVEPVLALVVSAAACSGARFESSQHPALSMPAHFAEGSDQTSDAGAPTDAGADGRSLMGAAARHGSAPDPEALRQTRQYVYEIIYDKGNLRVTSVRAVRYQRPVVTARTMGRFAIELWIGHELVERVRFDFPLVAAEDPRHQKARPLDEPPSFAAGVVATQTVLVPASPRATRAWLVDRATGQKTELPWPPEAPLGPVRTELPRAQRAEDAGSVGEAGPQADAALD